MTISLSSKCDRNCRHCDVDANMDGCFFAISEAHLLAKKLTEYANRVKEKEGLDCYTSFSITGNGESLLNPNLSEITRILFSECPTLGLGLVTSGCNNLEEERRLLGVLRQPFARNFLFSLSFNIFQSRFPKRLLRTMKLLYENGVDHVDIKIVLTHKYVYRTIHRLNRLIEGYFVPWVKKVDSLADRENAFSPIDLGKNMEKMTQELSSQMMTNVRPPLEWELGEWFVFFQTNFPTTYQFETLFGRKTFSYFPQPLIKLGRAKRLNDYLLSFDDHLRPCSFLTKKEYTKIHIEADGYYYPNCDCPRNTALRIGHVSEDIDDVLKKFFQLKYLLLGYMIWEKRRYEDMCSHCIWVWGKMRRIGILEKMGIDYPQESSSKLIAPR